MQMLSGNLTRKSNATVVVKQTISRQFLIAKQTEKIGHGSKCCQSVVTAVRTH